MDTMTYASVATLPKSVIEYSQHEMKVLGRTGNATIFHPVMRPSLLFCLLAPAGRSSRSIIQNEKWRYMLNSS
jgi:hypothetical protein